MTQGCVTTIDCDATNVFFCLKTLNDGGLQYFLYLCSVLIR
ncbi:hypothetical protein HMPREF3034_01526 [Prevotella sp. DNF00663]|nr:hypothetical protein HMPREF3034_01526 [Prevotella sp. DNF00663]